MSYILGTLYSFFNFSDDKKVAGIARQVEEVLAAISYKENYDLLVGKISSDLKSIDLIVSGEGIVLNEPLNQNKNATINLEESSLIMQVNDSVSLEISKK